MGSVLIRHMLRFFIQLSPLDLAVLRHITEYGCKGSRHITESLSLVPIDPLELHDAFPRSTCPPIS